MFLIYLIGRNILFFFGAQTADYFSAQHICEEVYVHVLNQFKLHRFCYAICTDTDYDIFKS